MHNVLPQYFLSFIPCHSIGNDRYQVRHQTFVITKYKHVFIKLTFRCQLPLLLNNFIPNHTDDTPISNLLNNIHNIPLVSYKCITKSHFYLNTLTYVQPQIAMFVNTDLFHFLNPAMSWSYYPNIYI